MATAKNAEPESEFGDEIKPFETKLKESYMFSRQEAFNRHFISEILPGIVRQYGFDDKPAIAQGYNDYLDSLERDGQLPDSSRNWTLPDSVTQNPAKYVSESVQRLVEYGTDRFDDQNTVVETLFERDRKYVRLLPVNNEGKPHSNIFGNPIIEWKDEDVDQAIEDGYLDPRDWHASALSSAKKMGLIKETKSSYSLKSILNEKNKKSKKSNPCWSGYEQVGTKTGKDGKEVPNCVPKEDLNENKDYETKRGRQPQEQGDVEESHTIDWAEVKKAAEDAAEDIFGKVDKSSIEGIIKDTKQRAKKDSSLNTKDAIQIAIDKMRSSK